jgi:hypothetical protein
MDKDKHLAHMPSKESVKVIPMPDRTSHIKPYVEVLSIDEVSEYIDDLDDFSDEEKVMISQRLEKFSGGSIYTSVVMCRGEERCSYSPECPFAPDYPEGKKCPVERALANKWFQEYMVSLGVDMSNRSEVSMLQTIVAIELHLMRANSELSYQGLQQKVYKSAGDDTTIIERKEHSLIATIGRLNDQKIKLIKAFNATREGSNAPSKKDPVMELQEAMKKLGLNK